MPNDPIVDYIFLIFAGAAMIATLALYARQALLVAYILVGIIAGPSVTGLVSEPAVIEAMSHIGIIFLLFLLGLDLEPQELIRMLRKTTIVTFASSALFASGGALAGMAFGFTLAESLIIGAALTFSSTIIGLKLLPTTALHHQHAGQVMISVLLMQDLIAIVMLLIVQGYGGDRDVWTEIGMLAITVPLLIVGAFLFAKYVLLVLVARFDQIHEYIFLLAIGWCLSMAELGTVLGLSLEIGAFIGGVTLATSPIARFIAESLRPLRDFFLIMFFFSLGAGLEMGIVQQVLVPSLVIGLGVIFLKPWVFGWLLHHNGETKTLSREIGFRLGQISEFSLLLAVLAVQSGLIGQHASSLIQVATVFTFMVSSYLIIMRYPTPIAVSDRLRRD